MITKVGHRFEDGRVALVGYVPPDAVMHAYTEDEDGAINESLLITCSDDGVRAHVYSSVDPQAIIRPEDPNVAVELLVTAQYVTKVLRGAEREFPMVDADLGAFHLVVTQLVEMPEELTERGKYN